MSKFAVAFLFAGLVAFAAAHAGLKTPPPRSPGCTATGNIADCDLQLAPCGNTSPGTPTVLSGGSYNIVVFQRVSHYDGNNTYTLSYYDTEGNAQILWDGNQTPAMNGEGIDITFPVTLPSDVYIPDTIITMRFDATAGSGSVYYSCADVTIGVPPKSSASSVAVSAFALIAAVAALLF